MKTLPLFFYPSTWVLVDDDKILLTTIEQALNQYNTILTFSTPNDCVKYFDSYDVPSSKFNILKSNIQDENYGVLQHVPMSFNINSIFSLMNDLTRDQEITSIIIDYNMPGFNGFDLAKFPKLNSIPKILLAGDTRENIAIQGFNDNLIDRFVQKSEEDMFNRLAKYLKELTIQYFTNLTSSLLTYLEADEKLPLSDPKFVDFFEIFCESNKIIEYYLIDKNGSFLCIDKQGNELYLVVHTPQTLNIWLEVNSDNFDSNKENFYHIKEHQKIPFFGVGKESWQIKTRDWSNYFYVPNVLQGRTKYLWKKISAQEFSNTITLIEK